MYRKELHLSLVKELLGPRNGAYELMEDDPREEYMVGILEPRDYERGEIENYSDSDFKEVIPTDKGAIEDGLFEDDDADTVDLDQRNDVPVSIDPRALPKSMGISFVVETPGIPLINICVTWARYLKENSRWKRQPKKHIILNHDARKGLDEEVEGILIKIKSINIGEKKWHVSVYVVNVSKVTKETRLETGLLIFQPQIRVRFNPNVKAASLLEYSMDDENEKRLAMLYRDLPALARGHMCSAVWKNVDVEKDFEGSTPEEIIPPDIKILDEEHRRNFINPDIRSEYLPAYSIVQSTVDINEIPDMKIEYLDSDILSKRWNPEAVVKSLHKLTSAYENWIFNEDKKAETLSSSYRDIAIKNISLCRVSLSRMKDGIDILEKNEDAMLAFYFMNKAMCKQSEWIRKTPLIWRPFQMAFVLQCIRGIVDESHPDRNMCDLLWFPTGGGKTEAYLGLMIFTLAYLRRKHKFWEEKGFSNEGTAIISRYTLRMLTIQQFRRTLNAITACELLRTSGWKPAGYAPEVHWGKRRFSIGLWIGGGVTPNKTMDHGWWDIDNKVWVVSIEAAGKLMYRKKELTERMEDGGGEPAQVSNCPVCSSVLAIPKGENDALPAVSGENYEIFWTVSSQSKPNPDKSHIGTGKFRVTDVKVHNLPKQGFYILELHFTSFGRLTDLSVNEWWNSISKTLGAKLECASGSRPGYFIKRLNDIHKTPIDFEIRCPNPNCELNHYEWNETNLHDDESATITAEPFEISSKTGYSKGIPIPAFTVDSQIYSKCPSIILATIDKFARLPFEPHCASIFGNIDRYDTNFGFYREGNLPDTGGDDKLEKMLNGKHAKPFAPPQLIIQDELHLIEGPLGSLYGLYEIAIDSLSTMSIRNKTIRPKYIASTATIRQADDQIMSLCSRELKQFPSQGISILDNFFSKTIESHILDDKKPGRLYMGVCAPGKGPQSPVRNIWTNLLQTVETIKRNNGNKMDADLDRFWTLVGYFNAVRELAGVASLYRQDIQERIKIKYGNSNARPIDEHVPIELSSRSDSLELHAIMKQLEKSADNEVDAVLATSMFGTGVDVDRLGLMVVHGQPKTTANYIQSTGRVGRKKGGLVVTFLRSTRPRDLNHYEFFIGYHRALHRQVEAVTVAPFSARAIERALGPVLVGILRNAHSINGVTINPDWSIEIRNSGQMGKSGSRRMSNYRDSSEIKEISKIIMQRSQEQPERRRKDLSIIEKNINSDLSNWKNIAKTEASLFYSETKPKNAVVLGDEKHKKYHMKQVFENVLQSLREVEQTSRFEG